MNMIEVRFVVDLSPRTLEAVGELGRVVAQVIEALYDMRLPDEPIEFIVPEPPEAAAASPAPDPPAPAKQAHPTVWTPERRAILERDYPRGVPIQEICTAVNELPGPKVQAGSIAIKAASLQIYRKPRPAPVAEAGAPKPATYLTIRKWAEERGLAPADEPLDLAKVNARRFELGLPPFERVPEGDAP